MAPAKPTLAHYHKLDKIGEGTYGVVYKAKSTLTGEIVAMKKIRIENEEEGVPVTALREISMLQELHHPNIVDLKDVILEGNKLHLVFEFLDCDLKSFMDKMKKNELMKTSLLKSFTYQITQGMCYCHQRRILHRDLKPQNLLVDVKSNTIKLADFGLARAVGIPARPFTHEVVTLWYRAPEVLLGVEKYSMAVDVWSIGCIFAEMARRRPLWQGDSEIDQLFRIFKILTLPTELDWPGFTRLPEFEKSKFPTWTKNLLRDEMADYIDELGLNFLEGTLARNPEDRMTTKDMLLHPYFEDLDKKTLPAGAYDGTVLELGEPRPLADLENMPVA